MPNINTFFTTASLIIIPLLLVFCSKEYDNKISVEIIHEIKLESEATRQINRLYPNMTTSPDQEYLAISNITQPAHILLVDYDGHLIKRVGSQGRGPDEIERATNFGLSKSGTVVVEDKGQALIKEFHVQSDSVTSFDTPIKEDIYITSLNFTQCDDYWIIGIDHLADGFQATPEDGTPVIGVFDQEFNIVKTAGNYDSFMKGEQSIQQEPVISVDCNRDLAFTGHGKIPFIQIVDLKEDAVVGRIDSKPPSFMLSNEFIDMIEDISDYEEFLITEQSMTSHITHDEAHIIQTFFNETREYFESRDHRARDHYIAVYDRENLSFLGELQLEGAAMGSTNNGHIIELVDDDPENFTIRFLNVKTE